MGDRAGTGLYGALSRSSLCSRGRDAVRDSAVPEVGAASGKQREIKARRARRQLEIGVCVPVRGCACVWAYVCLHSVHTCSPDAYFWIVRDVSSPLLHKPSILFPEAGLQRKVTPKCLPVPSGQPVGRVMGKVAMGTARLGVSRHPRHRLFSALFAVKWNRDNVRLKPRNVWVIAGSLLLSCCVQHNYQCWLFGLMLNCSFNTVIGTSALRKWENRAFPSLTSLKTT